MPLCCIYSSMPNDWNIQYAKCSSKAGAGSICKHVAAVLYQLVEYRNFALHVFLMTKHAQMFCKHGMYQARQPMINLLCFLISDSLKKI